MLDKASIVDMLTKIGFSQKEALAYTTLLELGETLPSSIVRRTKLKRPTVYCLLEVLEDRKLVSHFKRDGLTYVKATPPSEFLFREFKRHEETGSLLKSLDSLLPRLHESAKDSVYNLPFTLFQGRTALDSIIKSAAEINEKLICFAPIGSIFLKRLKSQKIAFENHGTKMDFDICTGEDILIIYAGGEDFGVVIKSPALSSGAKMIFQLMKQER
jgi:sugar-specific transcriptional regulator TrmB